MWGLALCEWQVPKFAVLGVMGVLGEPGAT